MRLLKLLILVGLGISLIFGDYTVDFIVTSQNISSQAFRRVRNPIQIPEQYRNIVEQLNHDDPQKRKEAIESITDIVINKEEDENIRRLLTLKVAERLGDPHGWVREAAAEALGEIIPSLKE
jgi:hypothetical protein